MQRGRIQLYLLIFVFLGPLALAAVAYYGPWEWLRPGGAAHGELLSPPVALPSAFPRASAADDDGLRRRWSLVYAAGAPCAQSCVDRLNRLNQVRLALGQDLGRVRLVVLFAESPPALPAGAEVTAVPLDGAGAEPLRTLLDELGLDRVYIADPAGRLVMSYPPDVDQRGLLEDLERLMALSTIG